MPIKPEEITDDAIIERALWVLVDDAAPGDIWVLLQNDGWPDDVDDGEWNAVMARIEAVWRNHKAKMRQDRDNANLQTDMHLELFRGHDD